MKSKLTTYMLSAVVVAVWGVIAWKLLRSAAPPTGTPPLRAAEAERVPGDTLSLDYRDPFLGREWSAELVGQSAPQDFSLQPPPVPPSSRGLTKHNVRYVGRIRRQGTEYSLAEINGTLHTLQRGEQADGYRLERISPDSLHFTFQGEACGFAIAE